MTPQQEANVWQLCGQLCGQLCAPELRDKMRARLAVFALRGVAPECVVCAAYNGVGGSRWPACSACSACSAGAHDARTGLRGRMDPGDEVRVLLWLANALDRGERDARELLGLRGGHG